MRITHVITRLIVGGAQENTITSVLGLRQKPGLTVDLISGSAAGPEGSLADRFNQSPETLTLLPELVRPVHPWKDSMALRRLTEIFRRQRPQIVHTHSGKAGVLGRFAAAKAGVPLIIHTIHGPSFGPFQGPLANFIFRAAERRAGRVTHHFVAVADAMIEQYLAAGIGRREQYTRIFSGFDLQPYLTLAPHSEWRSQLGLAPDDIVVGKIARLFKLKGHDDLLAVAPALIRRCPRIKFVLVGDGPGRSRLEQKVRALGLEARFHFSGLVSPDQIPRWLEVMDILVHLSLREGLPRALPQALAAGRPVVAYDCDGAKEVCLENETGFLLRAGDLDGLTNRLLQLAQDAPLREQLGGRGRQWVKDRFAASHMVDALHHLYLNLARARGINVP